MVNLNFLRAWHLPHWSRPYARLMRLDRPIGIWLLLIPCWWSVALASPRIPDLWFLFLFAVGAVVMRAAGCIINDLYDRKLDAMVARTRNRPLASGEVKIWQALLLLLVLLLIGLGVLLLFNRLTIAIGVLSLIPVGLYPVMKRITWWPQLFLGFTFNWGALMGWSAVTDGIGVAAVLLYIAGIFWTLGYDTIYAHQDKEDDLLAGIKSTALLFGDQSRLWVAGFYAASLVLFALTGWMEGLGDGFFALVIFAALFALVQLLAWRMDDASDSLRRFASNRDFGLILFAALVLGKFV
ncbi:MAG: 4-hydroxybenzoate octaprenyltransferase [Alphaproteobacteria bacterium]|nr:4-hydroxybenzoate octaprenyltransferase [Alphaproteobacteria bacterium]